MTKTVTLKDIYEEKTVRDMFCFKYAPIGRDIIVVENEIREDAICELKLELSKIGITLKIKNNA